MALDYTDTIEKNSDSKKNKFVIKYIPTKLIQVTSDFIRQF